MDSRAQDSVDLEYVSAHFNPLDQRLVGDGPLLGDGLWRAIDLMLEECPVAPTDGRWYGIPGGGWVVNRFDDVMTVIRSPEIFSNRVQKGGTGPDPELIPFDLDPPRLLEYRRMLQPFLTLKAVERFEPAARGIATGLLDRFVASGRCDDAAEQVAYGFSTQLQWHSLVGVDDADHDQVLKWVLMWLYGQFEPGFEESTRSYLAWLGETVARRRREAPRGDLIDGLIAAELEGRRLTDDEITRLMLSLITAGVTVTAEAIANILLRLAVYPELQDRLRADPALLPIALEEFLRIEPPVTGAPRRCVQDTELGGRQIKAGDGVFIHIAAANRDPRVFERADELEFDRARSSHLAFGAGNHRCLGSNLARMSLGVVFREILARMHDIRLIEDDPPRRTAGVGWRVSYLPLRFTPG